MYACMHAYITYAGAKTKTKTTHYYFYNYYKYFCYHNHYYYYHYSVAVYPVFLSHFLEHMYAYHAMSSGDRA